MSGAARRLAALALAPVPGEWRRAMLAELDHIEGRAARWRFALGCIRVAALPAHVGRYAAGLLGSGAALAAYGVLRWPGVIGDDVAIGLAFLIVLALLLAAYAWVAATVARGPEARLALAGGIVAGLAALALVAAVGAIAGVRSGDPAAGVRAGGGAALIVGFAGFVTILGVAYLATDRIATDPALLAQFRTSGARDATTYAVGETMAGAVNQLWLASLPAALAGAVGAAIGAARSRS